jgi:hypothetical protein
MENFSDVIIISISKIMFIVGTIYGMKYWKKRTNNIFQKLLYWILGLYLVFNSFYYLFTQIFRYTIHDESNMLTDYNSLNTISVIISISLFIYIGLKILKKNKNLKKEELPLSDKKNSKILMVSLSILALATIILLNFNDSETNEKEEKVVLKKSKDKSILNFLNKTSKDINAKCPIQIDKGTRLDNTVVLLGQLIQYNYSLINIEKKNTDIETFKKKVEPMLLNYVKTNNGLKPLKERNIIISFNYKDKNGEFLFSYDIKPELYK